MSDQTETYAVIAAHPIDLPAGVASYGDRVELTEADAAGFVADGHLIPVDITDTTAIPTRKADLQKLADDLGLDTSGTVAELTDRIEAHHAAQAANDSGPAGENHNGGDANGTTASPTDPTASETGDAS